MGRKERVQKEDGTRWNLFHLVDDSAGEQLAVIGEVHPPSGRPPANRGFLNKTMSSICAL